MNSHIDINQGHFQKWPEPAIMRVGILTIEVANLRSQRRRIAQIDAELAARINRATAEYHTYMGPGAKL